MKNSRTLGSARAAFTLIELLVVITILGILMSMAVGGTSAVKNQARKAQAQNDCTGLVVAIKAFYTDYSRYPVPATKTDDVPYEPTRGPEGNKDVVEVLTAVDAVINPRGVVYYEAKTAKQGTGGSRVSGISNGGMFDPWGFTYGIMVDADYDGRLIYSGPSLNKLEQDAKVVQGGVGVFSLGDKQKNPLTSWQ